MSTHPVEELDKYRYIFQPSRVVGQRQPRTRIPAWVLRPAPDRYLEAEVPCSDPKVVATMDVRPASNGLTETEKAERTYQIAKARRVCHGAPGYAPPCPIIAQCLEYGLRSGSTGFYGGQVVTSTMAARYGKEALDADAQAD